jgi:hypothetical protein
MAIDLSTLIPKVSNEGDTPAGRLDHTEFNKLVNAVIELQSSGVKTMTINNGEVKFRPDDNGNVNLMISESNYNLSLTTTVSGNPPYNIALNGEFMMHVKVLNKFIEGDSASDTYTACKAEFYCNNSIVHSREVYDKEEFDFNWGPYLSEGKNTVYIKVDNNFGEVKTSNPVEINAIFIQLDVVNFNDLEIKSDDSWSLDIRVTGTSANVYVFIDGNEIINAYQSAGALVTYDIVKGLTNGTHILEAYAISDINTTVRTNTISYEYIYSTEAYSSPIIATELRDDFAIQLYNILKVKYWIYYKGFSGKKTVSLTLFDDLNPNISTSTQEIELENGISKKYIFDVVLFEKTLVGPKNIKITIDDEERIIPIIVQEPEYELKQIEGYDVYLSSAGRDNKDNNYNDWSYGQYHVTFADDIDFTDTGSGWINDADGNKALHLRKGKYISLNYKPFATNPAYGNNSDIPGTKKGLTFSIELATRNCINRDASVVRCMHNGIGFEFFANKMIFQNSIQSMTAEYKEDTRVRIDLVIEGSPIAYTYYDYNDKTYKTSEEARMLVYVDGVYQQMLLMSEYSNFKQEVPQDIEIGSNYCDIDIYCIRAYNTALDFKAITDNYSFDTPVVADKINIAKRCNVFDSKLNVTYKGLQEARPELPILIVSMKDLPTSKDRLPVASTAYTNPLNPDDYEKGNASFTVGANAEMGNQGTSSMNYPMPYRNFDWRISKSSIEKPFIIGGQGYKKYPMYLGMPPIKKLTFKKDYASSEMANNAICSSIITDMACGIYENYPDVLSPAMQDAVASGKSPDTYRLGLKAIPMFMFNYYNNEYTPLGMFNFIPNKNEEEYLGFTNTGLHKFTFEDSRAQSWEIRDNNIFWDFYLNPTGKDSGGNIVNDVFRYYEAIYPKDNTAETGDFGEIKNESDLNNAINETRDILRLHNWLVDTNQLLATGTLLSNQYVDSSGRKFEYDTAEYRRAKFMTEYKDYIILDSWVLYYIWREQFWMMDSGSKNLQIHTFDGIHWGAHVRDADTGVGTDNEGKLVFPHYLEDVDFRDNTTNKFIFNQTVQPDNSSTVLNGQLGSIWINIRDCYKDRIQEIYNALFSNSVKTKFSYDEAIKCFEDHQGQWSEALYNFGSKQYYGGTPYSKWISSGLGDKKNQRRYWLYYGFRYRMSKYHAGSGVNRITWRTYGSGSDLLIKPYCELYVCLGFGTYDYKTTKRYRCLNPSEGVLVKNEYTQEVTDNVCYLFNGDLITDLGNLYEFGDIGSLDLTVAKRLRYLRVGNNKKKDLYSNSKLTSIILTNCESLEYIDFTNCRGFGKGENQNGIFALQLQNQSLLQEFYASGATMTNVMFPETPSLRVIELGSELTSLDLQNLIGLEYFSLDGGSKIQTLKMNNCGTISSEQSYNILVQIFSGENVLKNVDIRGINWTNASGEILEKLCDLKANLRGYINLSQAKPMSYALKSKLVEQYGDIDNPQNPLYVTYRAYEISNLICDDKIYFENTGEYQIKFSIPNVNGNNFVVDGITYEMDYNEYSTLDSKTGKLTINYLGEEYEDGTGPNYDMTITMKLYRIDSTTFTIKRDEQYTISTVINLNFWNRELRIGDIVYHDGFTSSAKDVETYKAQGREPIGVCFYIDEHNPNLRLMFALNPIAANSYTNWGPSGNDITPGSISFQDVTETQLFDVSIIPNTGESGLNSNISDWSKIVYEDEPGKYKFIDFPETCCLHYGGFIEVEGQMVPQAKYFTENIIRLRNRALMDPGLTELGLSVPAATSTNSEMNNLLSAIDKATKITHEYNNSNDLECLYYPAASLCYAFKPTQKAALDPKFGEHKWFLPCMGDLLKIGYYLYNYYTKENESMDKFKDAIDYEVLKKSIFETGNSNFCSINESSLYNSYPYYIWVMRLNMLEGGYGRKFDTTNGFGSETAVYINQKYTVSFKFLPICQF